MSGPRGEKIDACLSENRSISGLEIKQTKGDGFEACQCMAEDWHIRLETRNTENIIRTARQRKLDEEVWIRVATTAMST